MSPVRFGHRHRRAAGGCARHPRGQAGARRQLLQGDAVRVARLQGIAHHAHPRAHPGGGARREAAAEARLEARDHAGEALPPLDDGHGGKITETVGEVAWSEARSRRALRGVQMMTKLPDRPAPPFTSGGAGVRARRAPVDRDPGARKVGSRLQGAGARTAAHAEEVSARPLLAALALCAGEAAAHTELVASSPADGASLASAPARIELVFNEPVTPLGAKLFDGSRHGVAAAGAAIARRADRNRAAFAHERGPLHVRLPRVVADSHPVGGAIIFAVGVPAGPSERAMESDESSIWRFALRAVRDLALLIVAGAGLFVLAVARFSQSAPCCSLRAGGGARRGAGDRLPGQRAPGPGREPAFRRGMARRPAQLVRPQRDRRRRGGARARWRDHSPRRAADGESSARSIRGGGEPAAHGPRGTTASIDRAVLATHGLAAAFWAGSLVALLSSSRSASNVQAGPVAALLPIGRPAVAVLFIAGIMFACSASHRYRTCSARPTAG